MITRLKKQKINAFALIVFAVLALYTLTMIILIGWGLFSSFKDPMYDFRINKLWLPKQWKLINYENVYSNFVVQDPYDVKNKVTMLGQIKNTLLICTLASFCSTFFPCLVGYLVAKYKYKFSAILHAVALIVMSLPIIGSAPSELKLLKDLGIYNKFITVFFHRSSYLGIYFFVFIATFRAISNDFYEAAALDGANDFKIYFTIMLPMVRQTFLTVLLLIFVTNWNDYQYALMYLPSMPTLAYGLFTLSTSTLNKLNNVPVRMAGCGILMLPILILFIIFKEKLMGNLSMGGLKE